MKTKEMIEELWPLLRGLSTERKNDVLKKVEQLAEAAKEEVHEEYRREAASIKRHDTATCPHGRAQNQPCLHCLGINNN